MKAIGKRILTGAVAAAVLFGGGVILHTYNAYADNASTAVTSSSSNSAAGHNHSGHKHEGGFYGNNIVKETAAILGTDEQSIKSGMKQGKTIAQLAQDKGLTEDAFLQKLVEAEGKNIDAAVSAGKMQQAQADKIKSGLSDRLKKEIESTKSDHFRGEKHGEFGGWGNAKVLTQILGITEQELQTELKAGKSIAQIAQDKGISEDDLISKLKDGMTDQLKQFVEKTRTPHQKNSTSTAAPGGSNS